jgi:putative methyltransferase (TIGR04325 family)
VINQLPKSVPTYIWKNTYPSWDAACEAAKSLGEGGYGGDRWLQRITQQLSDYRKELKKYGIAMSPRPSNLPLICGMATPSAIVDFGGSSGWCWDYLQNSLPKHNVTSYCVVETEGVVNYMTRSGLHTSPVKYQRLNDSNNSCDILYCNSVLQYFGSNAPLLSLIERTKPEYILLDDLIAKGEEDFFTVQTYYDSDIPYRFVGLSKLLNQLTHAGYKELVRFPYASPIFGAIKPFEMGNFPEEKQQRYSLSVILSKIYM